MWEPIVGELLNGMFLWIIFRSSVIWIRFWDVKIWRRFGRERVIVFSSLLVRGERWNGIFG